MTKPICLPDQLLNYPDGDGTREGAQRAAAAAIAQSLADQKAGKLTPPTKRHIAGLERPKEAKNV